MHVKSWPIALCTLTSLLARAQAETLEVVYEADQPGYRGGLPVLPAAPPVQCSPKACAAKAWEHKMAHGWEFDTGDYAECGCLATRIYVDAAHGLRVWAAEGKWGAPLLTWAQIASMVSGREQWIAAVQAWLLDPAGDLGEDGGHEVATECSVRACAAITWNLVRAWSRQSIIALFTGDTVDTGDYDECRCLPQRISVDRSGRMKYLTRGKWGRSHVMSSDPPEFKSQTAWLAALQRWLVPQTAPAHPPFVHPDTEMWGVVKTYDGCIPWLTLRRFSWDIVSYKECYDWAAFHPDNPALNVTGFQFSAILGGASYIPAASMGICWRLTDLDIGQAMAAGADLECGGRPVSATYALGIVSREAAQKAAFGYRNADKGWVSFVKLHDNCLLPNHGAWVPFSSTYNETHPINVRDDDSVKAWDRCRNIVTDRLVQPGFITGFAEHYKTRECYLYFHNVSLGEFPPGDCQQWDGATYAVKVDYEKRTDDSSFLEPWQRNQVCWAYEAYEDVYYHSCIDQYSVIVSPRQLALNARPAKNITAVLENCLAPGYDTQSVTRVDFTACLSSIQETLTSITKPGYTRGFAWAPDNGDGKPVCIKYKRNLGTAAIEQCVPWAGKTYAISWYYDHTYYVYY